MLFIFPPCCFTLDRCSRTGLFHFGESICALGTHLAPTRARFQLSGIPAVFFPRRTVISDLLIDRSQSASVSLLLISSLRMMRS